MGCSWIEEMAVGRLAGGKTGGKVLAGVFVRVANVVETPSNCSHESESKAVAGNDSRKNEPSSTNNLPRKLAVGELQV